MEMSDKEARLNNEIEKWQEENDRLNREVRRLEKTKRQVVPTKVIKVVEKPAEEPELCRLTLQRLSEKRGRSWMTFDTNKKEIEKIKFTKPQGNNQICIRGQKSRYNCYHMDEGTLQHVTYRGVFAKLTATGELKWSHGYSTKFETNLCP